MNEPRQVVVTLKLDVNRLPYLGSAASFEDQLMQYVWSVVSRGDFDRKQVFAQVRVTEVKEV